MSWHPDVATQLCLSSEDDHTPVIQLWDLRYATSPVKQLENHTRYLSFFFKLKDFFMTRRLQTENFLKLYLIVSTIQIEYAGYSHDQYHWLEFRLEV